MGVFFQCIWHAKIILKLQKIIIYWNSENSAIKTLKYRYEKFLDDEKKRNKRNEHLLKMLERIDYQAATLAAKTERLKMLKVFIKKIIFST